MRHRVVTPHRAEPGEPLRAAAGERLAFERRPTRWAGWIWCTAGSGRTGWVPESWVEVDPDGSCRLTRDYDATEVTVSAGETVSVELEESGWAWVRRDNGERGWVPLGLLRAASSP
jgi:uncharacterized protein YgiM (DUF1202 family)